MRNDINPELLPPPASGSPSARRLEKLETRARTHLEQPGLADPQIHDATLRDQIVVDRLNKTGMGCGARIGVGGGGELAALLVDEPETLRRAGDAVGVEQAGVEPLRAVRGGHLVGQHVLQLVLEGLGVVVGGEVVVLLAPMAPRIGEAVEHVFGGALRAENGVAVKIGDRVAVFVHLGDAGLSEILGDHDVGGDLGPGGGDFGILHLEHDGSVGVGDLGIASHPFDVAVRIVAGGW